MAKLMLYDPETQGHDSQIESVIVDAPLRTVLLRFSSYPSLKARERVSIEVAFEDVTSMSVVADLKQMEDNYAAGNVNHWHVAEGAGTSFFYLIEGCLTITAGLPPRLTLL
jgi:hypothetical protein